jgi:hypothetical protein
MGLSSDPGRTWADWNMPEPIVFGPVGGDVSGLWWFEFPPSPDRDAKPDREAEP